jgi:hypothetical protein
MANVSKKHNRPERVRGATVEKETMLRSYTVPEGASQLTLGRVRHLFLVRITDAVATPWMERSSTSRVVRPFRQLRPGL